MPYFSKQIRVKLFEFFSNILLTSSMFSSERAVLCFPKFSLFSFRLVPCKWYFVTLCWIVSLQGGAWLIRCQSAAVEFLSKILYKWYVEWGIATGKGKFQTPHKMSIRENFVAIPRWKDFPFTCDRKDLSCAMERKQNFVLSD